MKIKSTHTPYLMYVLFAIILFHCSNLASAQGVKGQVTERKDPLVAAEVQAFQNGVLQGGCVTDFDGNYVIKPLKPGPYSLVITYTGLDSAFGTITVNPDSYSVFNCSLIQRHNILPERNMRCKIGALRSLNVYGKVYGKKHKTVPGAIIEIYKNKQLYDHAIANDTGAYSFQCNYIGIIMGSYTLKAYSQGYDTMINELEFSNHFLLKDVYLKPDSSKKH